jgi:hypothetical protein
VIAVRRVLEALRDLPDLRLPHQALDALFADGLALFPQVLPQAGPTIAMVARGMERAQLRPQHAVALRTRRQPASRPRVEPTARHPHTPAESRHSMLGFLRRDGGTPRRLCFAKNAVAFLRNSCHYPALATSVKPRLFARRFTSVGTCAR